ncbi:hypothetical protein Hydth_0354 [Hydrogenobacter thermophilus TK-6]|uniref:Lipoprotein n=1 Tax=Hydrogenobacter thermophilus (strain DSM 6534 / IAM 12695 / TK-6) TaxID=608538 RepID=D3DG70_HYDTT|nr:hypothetical protein [Hydrogenobacter thermophilus]ADO44757.1 hypothetical protein Hydth_0354 [Hydrogenobacter thermophilus TK-6]BAI68822.1 hypothetical protein HTH_0356 [Hydrogenobacter thermophilus TK-6]
MKRVFLVCLLMLSYACAPVVCPGEKEVRSRYSEDTAPKNYEAFTSLRYGILRVPIYIEKSEGKYTIRSPQTGTVFLKDSNLCVNATCLDLPVNPDGLIFGALLRGDEKPSCSFGTITFERDDQMYKRKYIFSNGELKRVELTDKNRDRILILEYGDRSKEGYYKRVKASLGDMTFLFSVDELKRR